MNPGCTRPDADTGRSEDRGGNTCWVGVVEIHAWVAARPDLGRWRPEILSHCRGFPDGLSLPKTTNLVKSDEPGEGRWPLMTDGKPVTQEELLSRTFRSTLPQVYGYLLRRLNGDRRDAEDVTQETYLAYVEALRAGVIIERPGAWLQVVARNKLVDHLRRQSRRSEQSGRIAADEPVLMRTRIEAEALLHELPIAQRTTMILRYLDDLTVADIAGLTGRSVRAVESLLARGRRSLSRRIDREAL